jgi:hypothetical protein
MSQEPNGYSPPMDPHPHTWTLVRTAPARADAEGLFVPASDLPQARLGDTVVVTGHEGGDERVGTIVEATHEDDQDYFRLRLAPTGDNNRAD